QHQDGPDDADHRHEPHPAGHAVDGLLLLPAERDALELLLHATPPPGRAGSDPPQLTGTHCPPTAAIVPPEAGTSTVTGSATSAGWHASGTVAVAAARCPASRRR